MVEVLTSVSSLIFETSKIQLCVCVNTLLECSNCKEYCFWQGYLVCLPLKNSLVAMDMSLILTLTTNVAQKPTKQLQVTAPSIGDGATVWDDEIQIYPKAQGWDASRVSFDKMKKKSNYC